MYLSLIFQIHRYFHGHSCSPLAVPQNIFSPLPCKHTSPSLRCRARFFFKGLNCWKFICHFLCKRFANSSWTQDVSFIPFSLLINAVSYDLFWNTIKLSYAEALWNLPPPSSSKSSPRKMIGGNSCKSTGVILVFGHTNGSFFQSSHGLLNNTIHLLILLGTLQQLQYILTATPEFNLLAFVRSQSVYVE